MKPSEIFEEHCNKMIEQKWGWCEKMPEHCLLCQVKWMDANCTLKKDKKGETE